MEESLKEIGKRTNAMERAMSDSQMGIFTSVLTSMVSQMGKEFTHGLMERSMMENGKMGLNTGTEFGKAWTMNLILGNGNIAKLMDTGSIHGKMEIDMKENGKNV